MTTVSMIMRITIRGRIFPRGGGDDAEHPTFIPMYTPTILQAPRGHTMRPQIYAIGHKVNLLLSKPTLSTCETWLLPPTCVLCMIRYLEESHGATTSNERASEDAKHKDQEKKLREATTTGRPTQPGCPAPEDPSRIYGRPEPPDVR